MRAKKIQTYPKNPDIGDLCAKTLKYGKKWSKTAEISEISPNSPKYRAHGVQNSFNALPVAQNLMLGKEF